jgi:hypothetical protein
METFLCIPAYGNVECKSIPQATNNKRNGISIAKGELASGRLTSRIHSHHAQDLISPDVVDPSPDLVDIPKQ